MVNGDSQQLSVVIVNSGQWWSVVMTRCRLFTVACCHPTGVWNNCNDHIDSRCHSKPNFSSVQPQDRLYKAVDLLHVSDLSVIMQIMCKPLDGIVNHISCGIVYRECEPYVNLQCIVAPLFAYKSHLYNLAT